MQTCLLLEVPFALLATGLFVDRMFDAYLEALGMHILFKIMLIGSCAVGNPHPFSLYPADCF